MEPSPLSDGDRLVGLAQLRQGETSIEPSPLSDRGTERSGRGHATSPLQWSRRLSATETNGPAAFRRLVSLTSMEPSPLSDGDMGCDAEKALFLLTSMEPSPLSDGDSPNRCSSRRTRPSNFNGAVASQRR